MTIRRQLLNFGNRSTDFRLGVGAFDELPTLVAGAVGRPRRAALIVGAGEDARRTRDVERALVDAGFAVSTVALTAAASTLDEAERVFAELARAGITSEDLVAAFGDEDACALATFCSRMWCGETPCALIPSTLGAMAASATEMRALDVAGAPGALSIQPQASLVVCDLDLVLSADAERNASGYARIVAAHLASNRRNWDRMGELAPAIASGDALSLLDALCTTQTSRLNTLKSVSPSARAALRYGTATARALRACLGPDVPDWRLLCEGMRFEARLAHDACDFSIDDVFAQDDRFEDLGIDEFGFVVEPERFVDELRRACLARANRFMLPLPKMPGVIRLASIDDEVLMRHARAYLASRAEIAREAEEGVRA